MKVSVMVWKIGLLKYLKLYIYPKFGSSKEILETTNIEWQTNGRKS